jgi:hypothetical protein
MLLIFADIGIYKLLWQHDSTEEDWQELWQMLRTKVCLTLKDTYA